MKNVDTVPSKEAKLAIGKLLKGYLIELVIKLAKEAKYGIKGPIREFPKGYLIELVIKLAKEAKYGIGGAGSFSGDVELLSFLQPYCNKLVLNRDRKERRVDLLAERAKARVQ